MHLAYPELAGWTGLAAAVALLAVVGLVLKRLRLRRLLELPIAGHLLRVRRSLQYLKAALVIVSATLLGIAILGPQWGHTIEEAKPAEGRDVLILLDVSRSMLAEDVAPNRLERAKADLRDLVTSLKQKGNYRVGLIAFADRAALLCPLTFDYRCFEEELSRASIATLRAHAAIGAGDGTQIGTALDRAERALEARMAPYTDILLISDGGDMEESTLAAANLMARTGVPVHAIGLGDPVKTSPIPLEGPGGIRRYLAYRGETVQVKLDEEVLKEVAQRTGGQYVRAGTGFLELDHWLEGVVAGKGVRELPTAGHTKLSIPRFPWFVAPAFVLLLLEMLIADGCRKVTPILQLPNYFGWLRRRQGIKRTRQTEMAS